MAPPKSRSGNPKKAAAKKATPSRVTAPPPLPTKADLQRKGPAKSEISILVDEDLAAAVDEAEQALSTARELDAPAAILDERIRSLQTARENAKVATVTLPLKAIGRKANRDLIELHPPTEEQNIEHREATKDPEDPASVGQDAPYNVETYAPALIAETVVAPVMSADEWVEYTDDWNDNEYMLLWMAVIGVNSRSRVGYWGKG